MTQRIVYYNSLRHGEVLKQNCLISQGIEFLPAELTILFQAFGDAGDRRCPVLPWADLLFEIKTVRAGQDSGEGIELRFELLAFEMLKKVPEGIHELIRNSSGA